LGKTHRLGGGSIAVRVRPIPFIPILAIPIEAMPL
jgi:hypothetical protein